MSEPRKPRPPRPPRGTPKGPGRGGAKRGGPGKGGPGRGGSGRGGPGKSGPNRSRDGRRDRNDRPRGPRLTNAQRARKAAAMAVADVLGRGFRLEGSLAKNPALDGLEPRDRAFARAIAANTLRRLGQVDAVLAPLVKRPPPGRVRAFMQTATAQMVFMDVAPHAAVGDAVALIKADSKSEPFAGLANAVLRRVADTGKAEAARVPPVANIPGWLRAEWERLYGKAAVRRMALLLAQSPPLDLSVKDDPQAWAATLGGEVLAGATVRLPEIGNVAALTGFEDGAWWAQDVAASLPARILRDAAGGLEGARVADLCAAPGGKTLQLAGFGANVTAVDLSEARTARMRENLARVGYADVAVVTADITQFSADAPFDAVLLDAPCSATGTFRRHPDVLYNRRERDITPLTRLQDTLLAQAASLVRPGGVLVYAVCSLQEREGLPRVRKLLRKSPDFRLIPFSQPEGLSLAAERLDPAGTLRVLPSEAPDSRGMDGFFIAALRRQGAKQSEGEPAP